MSEAIHRISVEMVLADGIFAAMTRLTSAFAGIEGKVDRIHNKIGDWKGAFALVAGAAGIALVAKGMDDLFKQMEEYQEKITGLRQLGLKPGEERAVQNEADRINALIRGTTPSGIMQVYRESRDIIGPEESLKALYSYSEFARALANMPSHSTTFEKATERLRPLIKASDIMGYMTDPKTGEYDPKRHKAFLDTSYKAIEASGGMIDENKIFGIASKGGISLRGLSPKGLMEMLAFSEIMGGQQSGTAMMSMFQQFAGGTMFPRVAHNLEKLGILKPGEYTTDHGKVELKDEAAARLGKFFQESPLEGMQVLKKAMEDSGITDPAAQQREIFKLLQRATTQRFFGEGLSNMQQMLRQTERMEGAETVEDSVNIQDKTSIKTALANVAAGYDSLLQAIGKDQGGAVATWIERFADVIRKLTEVVRGKDNDWSQFYQAISELTSVDTKKLREIAQAIHEIGAVLKWLANTTGQDVIDWALGRKTLPPLHESSPGNKDSFSDRWPTQSLSPWRKGSSIMFPKLPDSSGPERHSMMVVPPSQKPDVQRNVTAINLDGAQLAMLVEQRIAQAHENSDSASAANGVAYYNNDDWQPVSKTG